MRWPAKPKLDSESEVLKRLRKLSKGYTRLMRNNVGMLKDINGRFVRYGLGIGTSDLIGWHTIIIKPQHVGKKMALFLAVEAKGPSGVMSDEQIDFLQDVNRAGGLGIEARSMDHLLDALSLL